MLVGVLLGIGDVEVAVDVGDAEGSEARGNLRVPEPAGSSHRVAIYVLDWDTPDRTQKMEVLDGNTGKILDTQFSAPFHDGIYYVWNLSGHVQIRFTNLANGLNSVASGIFFS